MMERRPTLDELRETEEPDPDPYPGPEWVIERDADGRPTSLRWRGPAVREAIREWRKRNRRR